MFDYDWFHGFAYKQQCDEAKWRCVALNFPDVGNDEMRSDDTTQVFFDDLLTRTLIYLRDGFSYEIRQIAAVDTKSHLVFECEPVDQQYKVGSFVVSLPFEEIVRVEVFAVHPSAKPEDYPQITGFHSPPESEHKPGDGVVVPPPR